MNADIFYEHTAGRLLLQVLHRSGILKAAGWLLQTRMSGFLIDPYICKYDIDMSAYSGKTYHSFGEFFAREKNCSQFENSKDVLISPCDGLVSLYKINNDLQMPMKGSLYSISDIIPNKKAADHFTNGLCIAIRLEASDYHHFCFFDDCRQGKTHYIKGQLHSVQPIALRSVPVYKLNRRWWTLLDTASFGIAAQIEVGAVLVGGVTRAHKGGRHKRGDEMGNFELRGSTILLMFTEEVRKNLSLLPAFEDAWDAEKEVRVRMGEAIGRLAYEDK